MLDYEEGDLLLDRLQILTSKESKTENRQYFIQKWPEKKACQITNFPHPYPQLASLQKEMIRYQRKDGVQLTATLYLPPGYDLSKDGPLPCLVWSGLTLENLKVKMLQDKFVVLLINLRA
jgi:dipeptidyl aminopeptidase/acylaminoacyl peptidase